MPYPEGLDISDELIPERRSERPGHTPEDMTPWQRPVTACIDIFITVRESFLLSFFYQRAKRADDGTAPP